MSSDSEWEEQEALPVVLEEPALPPPSKKRLSKQMSMKEMTREAAWERRRRQILVRRRSERVVEEEEEEEEEKEEVVVAAPEAEEGGAMRRRVRSLTDEDLEELRGSIDLGFGFSEEANGGSDLRNTLPALDFYFAVNRQFSDPRMNGSPSPASTPTGGGSSSSLVGSPSPSSPSSGSADSWKILNPGDSPQHVKTRLRHWAQVVACSVRLSRQSGSSGNRK